MCRVKADIFDKQDNIFNDIRHLLEDDMIGVGIGSELCKDWPL